MAASASIINIMQHDPFGRPRNKLFILLQGAAARLVFHIEEQESRIIEATDEFWSTYFGLKPAASLAIELPEHGDRGCDSVCAWARERREKRRGRRGLAGGPI